jgi:hypothetical protein
MYIVQDQQSYTETVYMFDNQILQAHLSLINRYFAKNIGVFDSKTN